jgi:hypothetical protein
MRGSTVLILALATSFVAVPAASGAQATQLPCVGYATFERDGPNMQLIGLAVGDIPAGAKVTLACEGGSCPFAEKEFNLRNDVKTLALTDMFTEPTFKPGTKLEIRVTKKGWIGKVFQYEIRSSGEPRSSTQCLSADDDKPVACAKGTTAGGRM